MYGWFGDVVGCVVPGTAVRLQVRDKLSTELNWNRWRRSACRLGLGDPSMSREQAVLVTKTCLETS